MRIEGFVWFDEIIEKLEYKHKIKQEEVRDIFYSKPLFRFLEKGHRAGENVYAAMGQTKAGRYLIVFFVYKNSKRAIILSARDLTGAERKKYEEK